MSASQLPDDILAEIREQFYEFDLDKNGHITTKELDEIFKALNEPIPGYKLREWIAEVDKDKNGTVEFNEFLEMYCSLTSKGVFGQWKTQIAKRENIRVSGGTSEGSAEGTTHTSSHAEEVAFKDWINSELEGDEDCKSSLPIKTTDELFSKLSDGIIMCKMINKSVEHTIDERAINKTKLNAFLIRENNILVISSANAIGCMVVNIGPGDLIQGKRHLVLGLLWQIIRIGLFSKVSLQENPNLLVLCREGETIEDLLKLSAEELLLRWVNYHLERSGSSKRIENFSGDIKDSEAYAILLNQIAPEEKQLDSTQMILRDSDHVKRGEMVLRNADKLGCRKFVTAKDIAGGNAKLNLAFVANLFNMFPALDASDLDMEEVEPYEETREEKTFRCWMNSLGVNPFVNHVYNNLSDGLVLFQLYDSIKQGTVNWDKVNKAPFKMAAGGTMKKIENCNYAVDLGKDKNNYSLVGIGGQDIHQGNKLVLALVWQMLRHYSINMIKQISGAGENIADKDIIQWANQTLEGAGKTSRISSFKDPAIASSVPILDLVDAIQPGSVQYDLVTPATTEEDKELNAQYAISMCRKIDARTYALSEDLVEVKPKMVMTIFACLMYRHKLGAK